MLQRGCMIWYSLKLASTMTWTRRVHNIQYDYQAIYNFSLTIPAVLAHCEPNQFTGYHCCVIILIGIVKMWGLSLYCHYTGFFPKSAKLSNTILLHKCFIQCIGQVERYFKFLSFCSVLILLCTFKFISIHIFIIKGCKS